MKAQVCNAQGSCGLGILHTFQDQSVYADTLHNYDVDKQLSYLVGTGMFMAAFIDTPDCKKMLEHLTSKYKLLFTSPTKRNKNSGNDFFFAVFDKNEKPE